MPVMTEILRLFHEPARIDENDTSIQIEAINKKSIQRGVFNRDSTQRCHVTSKTISRTRAAGEHQDIFKILKCNFQIAKRNQKRLAVKRNPKEENYLDYKTVNSDLSRGVVYLPRKGVARGLAPASQHLVGPPP